MSDSATPWIAARQASLSITISRSSLKSRPLSQWCHPAISPSVIHIHISQLSLLKKLRSNAALVVMNRPNTSNWAPKSMQMVPIVTKLKEKILTSWKNSYEKPRQCFKKQRHHYIFKATVFPVDMYRCESWIIKNAECQRIDAFKLGCWRRPLRVPWTAGRSNQSTLKEINWIFIERTDAEAEAPILRPPDAKSRLIGKDSDTGKHWRQEEKGATEDELVGGRHCLNEHEFEETQGDVMDREDWHASLGLQRVRHDSVTEQQQH